MTRTEVVIANMALRRLGHAIDITDPGSGLLSGVTPTTPESRAASFWYAKKLAETLEDYAWSFARKVATLTLEDSLQDATDLWGAEWGYAYAYPTDCARAWRFSEDQGQWQGGGWAGSSWLPLAWQGQRRFAFQVADLADTKIILANVPPTEAHLQYTRSDVPLASFTELATSGLAWNFAAELARSFNKGGDVVESAVIEYRRAIAMARAQNANEDLNRPPQDGTLVRSHRGA
ncbi:MAG: hypothetical protein DRQ55_11230 [Planctomycetota bacterium]|nr:MAG: hypothetical protein DRQ55_11230 [Planctomycetota bacterium]